MKKPLLHIALITLILFSYEASSEIYKWVDDKGNTHFTDNPPKNTRTEEVKLKINTYSSVSITPLVERLGKKGKVVMYTATWCGICKKAKSYFVKNNIPHVTYDVEKSSIGKRDYKSLRGSSVPIIILGKKRMNGFTVARFDSLYKKQLKIDAEATKPEV
jgi:glutaredoxin